MALTSTFNTGGHHYVAVIELDHEHRQNKLLMKTNKPFPCRRCLYIVVTQQVFVDTMVFMASNYNYFNLQHSKSQYKRRLGWATWHASVIVTCGCSGWFGYHKISKHDVFYTAARSNPTPIDREFTGSTNYLQGALVQETLAILPEQTSPSGINHAAHR